MKNRPHSNRLWLAFNCLVSLIILSACTEPPQSSAPAAAAPPPPAVSVAQVIAKKVSEWRNFTGRLEASESIVVMPRTSGYVVSVDFEDGERVKKGDQLFQIDYRTIKAEVEQLEADVARANAEIELTERDLKRAESLRSSNSISVEQLDNRRTQLTQAKAAAASAKADLKRAKVLYAITTVKAEFDGQVSNARVKAGSSVVAGSTVLTTLVSTDKMHAYFDVDELTYLRLKKLAGDASIESMEAPVMMSLVDETGYQHMGVIDFVDNQVNISTGTIRLRAVFDNAQGKYTPGMFVRLKMRVGNAYDSILIDERAIGSDLNHRFVLVLGEQNIVEYRAVELGPKVEGLRSIKSGLAPGDVIVVKGLQRVFPGMPVTPETITMTDDATMEALNKRQVNSHPGKDRESTVAESKAQG